jgi:hypothetical protein
VRLDALTEDLLSMCAAITDTARPTLAEIRQMRPERLAARLEEDCLGRPAHQAKAGPAPSHAVAKISSADAPIIAAVVNGQTVGARIPEEMQDALADVLQRAEAASVPVLQSPFDAPALAAKRWG